MKKILIIGAGIGQVFIANKIKARGHYLITITQAGNYPVIDIADKVYYENVFNKEAVLEIARKEQIDGVVSDQNDMMMPIVAYVAEHLGLPGNYTSVVNAYCNKNVFRDNCDKVGIPVPKHCSVSKVEIPASMERVQFPWVVKPADAQSSVGVTKVNNESEYLSAVEYAIEVSKTHTAIVEQFFKGQELVAEGFIYKGQYYNLGFADRKYFGLEGLFIPSQTLFPSVVPQHILEMIITCEEKMSAYVEPDFAIVHSEYLYNAETGEICIVESALRGGGVYISSHLIPLYCGIDINEILLDCVEGKDINIESLLSKAQYRASGYVCFYLPEGRVKSINGLDEVQSMECVKMMEVSDIHVGMLAPKLTHKGQRLGPILLDAENRNQLEVFVETIQRTLHACIVGEDSECKGICWK